MLQKSPGSISQQECSAAAAMAAANKSPSSSSSKSPFSLSRQGTLRSSHRRKNSLATSLNLNPGRRSPVLLSPSGRRSPGFQTHGDNQLRSPVEFPGYSVSDRKSPTSLFPERGRSPTSTPLNPGRRSPIGFYEPDRNGAARSPTSTVHVQDRSKSPLGFMNNGNNGSGAVGGVCNVEESGRRSPTVQVQGRRSPIGFSQGLITCIPINTPTTEKRSPIGNLQIPPITVSNPSETCAIIEKTMDASMLSIYHHHQDKSPITDGGGFVATSPGGTVPQPQPPAPQERKEQRSVMREILAFVRKPSKKASCVTVSAAAAAAPSTTPATSTSSRTGRFAAAFSRAESGSGTPLLRQSTFSTSPAASSRAAKSAVTKQLSEAGFEPKISFKLLNSKMSLRLRRTTTSDDTKKDKRSSGDEMSDMESSDSKGERDGGANSSSSGHFELENVRFEKVGDSYIKHDKIREETLEDTSPSPVKDVAEELIAESLPKRNGNGTIQPHDHHQKEGKVLEENEEEKSGSAVELLKSHLSKLIGQPMEPIYANLLEIKQMLTDTDGDGGGGGSNAMHTNGSEMQIQCPTFEIMPPSRRSSFDPPRSPYLENLRSPCDTDPELMILNRGDSGGDSFELVDTDKNRESSFESRYPSSSHTSFDISRYQSTSYDDQTSSFEIIDLDQQQKSLDDKRSPIDLRKSSIELVDIDTFQRSEMAGRKSSLETHFDYQSPLSSISCGPAGGLGLTMLKAKRQVSEPNRCRDCSPNIAMKTYYSAPNRARSPLSNQTSSNYSSRDSYDSSFEPVNLPPRHHHMAAAISIGPPPPLLPPPPPPPLPPVIIQSPELKSPFADKSKQHFPLLIKSLPHASAATSTTTETRSFLCTDQRCNAIFEPRPRRTSAQFLGGGGGVVGGGSGNNLGGVLEFEPPSPRRAASASPKHTFTFRIVLKKVDSSPDAICPSAERRRSRDRTERLRRRDSRKKRLLETGKSF